MSHVTRRHTFNAVWGPCQLPPPRPTLGRSALARAQTWSFGETIDKASPMPTPVNGSRRRSRSRGGPAKSGWLRAARALRIRRNAERERARCAALMEEAYMAEHDEDDVTVVPMP